jgi:dUTP pyrophosphatase
MGQSVSSTFKESVVWSERRELSACGDEESAKTDDLQEQPDLPCASPIELCSEYSGAAKVPMRATRGAAGFDLYSVEDASLQPLSASGGVGTVVKTGVRLVLDAESVHSRISPDTVMFGDIRGRSSLAKKGIRVFQGTIDADYRGEVGVLMFNDTPCVFEIKKGDRIAQLLIGIALLPTFVEVTNVVPRYATERGEGGFGSTGLADGDGDGARVLAVPSEIVVDHPEAND